MNILDKILKENFELFLEEKKKKKEDKKKKEKRDDVIDVRVSTAELKRLKAAAKNRGYKSMSDFIRSLVR